jgi:hypothetical protein
VIVGPKILARGGRNEFFDLLVGSTCPDIAPDRMQVKVVRRTPVQHFRVIDSRHVYVEDPHDPLDAQRSVHVMDFTFWKGWQYDRAFERQWQQYQEPVSVTAVQKTEVTAARPRECLTQGTGA